MSSHHLITNNMSWFGQKNWLHFIWIHIINREPMKQACTTLEANFKSKFPFPIYISHLIIILHHTYIHIQSFFFQFPRLNTKYEQIWMAHDTRMTPNVRWSFSPSGYLCLSSHIDWPNICDIWLGTYFVTGCWV